MIRIGKHLAVHSAVNIQRMAALSMPRDTDPWSLLRLAVAVRVYIHVYDKVSWQKSLRKATFSSGTKHSQIPSFKNILSRTKRIWSSRSRYCKYARIVCWHTESHKRDSSEIMLRIQIETRFCNPLFWLHQNSILCFPFSLTTKGGFVFISFVDSLRMRLNALPARYSVLHLVTCGLECKTTAKSVKVREWSYSWNSIYFEEVWERTDWELALLDMVHALGREAVHTPIEMHCFWSQYLWHDIKAVAFST